MSVPEFLDELEQFNNAIIKESEELIANTKKLTSEIEHRQHKLLSNREVSNELIMELKTQREKKESPTETLINEMKVLEKERIDSGKAQNNKKALEEKLEVMRKKLDEAKKSEQHHKRLTGVTFIHSGSKNMCGFVCNKAKSTVKLFKFNDKDHKEVKRKLIQLVKDVGNTVNENREENN